MKHKTLLIVAFAGVALAQLFVPGWLIGMKADIALSGKEFRFKVDNNHSGSSLNGNYVWVRFKADRYLISDNKEWKRVQSVYVSFAEDSLGFAKIRSVSLKRPGDNSDWVKARCYIALNDSVTLRLNYPFNYYYLENKDLNEIEKFVSKTLNDTTKNISLKVKIKENQFIVKSLMVDSLNINDYVKRLGK